MAISKTHVMQTSENNDTASLFQKNSIIGDYSGSNKHVGIRANSSPARICALSEHGFGLSLSSIDSA